MNYKKINDYENYLIFKTGKVFSIKRNKFLKPRIHKGYYIIGLYKNGKRKIHSIHQLVCKHFIENSENKPCIDHINTIRTDNRVENLKWVTHKENSNNNLTKKKMSIAAKGNKKWLGKKHSEETKEKMSKAQKGKPKMKFCCLNCEKIIGGLGNLKKHYKKCKKKN